jgi:Hint domain
MTEKKQEVLSPTRRHLFSVLTAAAGSVLVSSKASAQFVCPPPVPSGEATYICFLQNGGNCFLRGTRIRTSRGERPIEDLTVGDMVETLAGPKPIKSTARQRFVKADRDWPEADLPVCITAGAISEGLPQNDLYVSQYHMLYIDDVLIPAVHLLNGSSIFLSAPERMAVMAYYHIAMETHEVAFAEGAPSETLLTGDMKPYAPIARYNGGRSELKALLRRLAYPVVDVRDPIQVAYDRIAYRAVA